MEQLLIVEDDIGLNQGLCKALKADARQIISCQGLKTAKEQLLCKAALVASQRDIDIIPEPCPHGDMPAPPEIGNTVGKKWKVKICIANQAQTVVSMIQSSLQSAPLLRTL